jgi:hypothetical protein
MSNHTESPRPTPGGMEQRLTRLGRGPTIALIGIIVLALAGAGLLAGAIAKKSGIRESPGLQGQGAVNGGSVVGAVAELSPVTHRVSHPSGGVKLGSGAALFGPAQGSLRQISPSPIGSPGETPSPGESTSPGESPSPSPSPTEGGAGSVVLDAGTVTVPVPDPWRVLASGDTYLTLQHPDNYTFIFAGVAAVEDPAVDFGTEIADVLDQLVTSDTSYSDVRTSDVTQFQPWGGLVSVGRISYSAIWADDQGSYDVGGNVYLGIRQDGKIFAMLVEISPNDEATWTANAETWFAPIFIPSYESFAGAPLTTG